MTFEQYSSYFETIKITPLEEQEKPYDNPDYLDYTKLNWSRMNRWLKTGKITEELKNTLQQIYKPQHWIVITEPWCGDAAHITPFLELAGRENPMIDISYELRDSEPFRIEKYRTNGTLSIPKLIIQDAGGKDMGTWGPRPKETQELYDHLRSENADFERTKEELQQWYNSNKGMEIQKELSELLRKII
ncbi:thioredoxin family protein [Salinimicrobium sp. CDJ15-81-2]|nr:thioredoxin family protein [Salinimicrobium nanhaiense]